MNDHDGVKNSHLHLTVVKRNRREETKPATFILSCAKKIDFVNKSLRRFVAFKAQQQSSECPMAKKVCLFKVNNKNFFMT